MGTSIPADLWEEFLRELGLSPRERQVVACAREEGRNMRRIAARLGISQDQVRQHIHRIKKKAKKLASRLDDPAPCRLSRRQRQVAELRDGGKSAAEIGHILGIKPPTVRRHLSSVRRKTEPCVTRTACPEEIPPAPRQLRDEIAFLFRILLEGPTREETLAAASTQLGGLEEKRALYEERGKLVKRVAVSARSEVVRVEGFWEKLLADVLETHFVRIDRSSWRPRSADALRLMEEARDRRLEAIRDSPDAILVLRRPAPGELAVAVAARWTEEPEASATRTVTGLGLAHSVWVDGAERKVAEVVFRLRGKRYVSCSSSVLRRGDKVSDAGEGRLLVQAWAGDLKPWAVVVDKREIKSIRQRVA